MCKTQWGGLAGMRAGLFFHRGGGGVTKGTMVDIPYTFPAGIMELLLFLCERGVEAEYP